MLPSAAWISAPASVASSTAIRSISSSSETSSLQRLRSFRNSFLRRMFYRNEDLQLVLVAGNFGDLFLVSIAVRLIVKTIGGIGPDKLDDFSLPRR